MKKLPFVSFLLALAGTLFLVACEEEQGEFSETSGAVTDADEQTAESYIIVFKEEAVPSGRIGEPHFTSRIDKAAYSREYRQVVSKRVRSIFSRTKIASEKANHIYSAAISGFAAQLTSSEAQKLGQDPSVAFVEPDRIMTIDYEVEARYTEQELRVQQSNARQSTTCAISNAGGAANGSDSEAFIWIIDTGIDLDHPDLNVVTDTKYAKAFAGGSPDDSQGHGTHVAGIAGAIANSIGVVGVSAGAPVVPIDVFGNSSGASTSNILKGMDHVAANDLPGDVVNMSLGGYGCYTNSAYRSALASLNNQSRIAIAAGNSSDDASFYDPACQNLSNVYTVASMTCDGSFSSFSNYGSPVDWIATGSSVTSTYPGGGYATLSGTSMASPVVAGVLHQRNSAPRSCGSVYSRGAYYPVACR